MPDYAFTLKLLNETGPLATTSANISGGLNPVNAREVLDQLDGRVDLILDGGQTPGGTASVSYTHLFGMTRKGMLWGIIKGAVNSFFLNFHCFPVDNSIPQLGVLGKIIPYPP